MIDLAYQPQWQQLKKAHEIRRLSHAYLFFGEHTGLIKTFALHFSQWLLCEKPDSEAACGHCKSCHLWLSQNHPDFLILAPEEGKKSISVDAVRELCQFIEKTPNQGGYQIVIVDPAETMTISAANALLKTLEEPAGQVVFILISRNLGRLPMTIRSRCQKLYFKNQLVEEDQIFKQKISEQISLLLSGEATWQAVSAAFSKEESLSVIMCMQKLVAEGLKKLLGVSTQTEMGREASFSLQQLLLLAEKLEELRRFLAAGATLNWELQWLNVCRMWVSG